MLALVFRFVDSLVAKHSTGGICLSGFTEDSQLCFSLNNTT